jgi:hypothetical protein
LNAEPKKVNFFKIFAFFRDEGKKTRKTGAGARPRARGWSQPFGLLLAPATWIAAEILLALVPYRHTSSIKNNNLRYKI